MEFKKAKLNDIKAMQNLVYNEVKNGIILPRSDNEIAQNIRSYILAFFEGRLVGYGALHIYSIELAEIRSLVVSSDLRGKGVGSEVVKNLLYEAKFYDIKKVFALTYADKFFKRLGFEEISKEELPNQKIWADCIKCKQFPICNEIAVIKTL